MQRRWVSILNLGIALVVGVGIGRFADPVLFAEPPAESVQSTELCGFQTELALGKWNDHEVEMVKVTAFVTNLNHRPISIGDARRAVAEPHCIQGEYR